MSTDPTQALRTLVEHTPGTWRGLTPLDGDGEPRLLLIRQWSCGQVDVLEIADVSDAVAYRCAPDDPHDFAAVQRSTAVWLRTGSVVDIVGEIQELPDPASGSAVRIT